MFSVVCVLAFVATVQAVCFSCAGTRSLEYSVSSSRTSATTYIMGIAEDAPKQYQTTTGQVVNGIVIKEPKFLKLPGGGRNLNSTAPSAVVILYGEGWDSCGITSKPYTTGKRQIFQVRTDLPFTLKEKPQLTVPQNPPPPPAAALWTPPEDEPACQLLETGKEGRCIDKATCAGPYEAFPFKSGKVDRGCYAYKAHIQCCALPASFVPIPRPRPRPAVLQELPAYRMLSCRGNVYDACLNGGAKCVPRAAADEIADNAEALGVGASDFPTLSTFQCAGKCVNGVCRNNACQCRYPFGGATCSTRLPTCRDGNEGAGETCVSKLEFSEIIPGNGTDVWMFGTTRDISFTVKGYEPALDTKKVEIYIVDKRGDAFCRSENGAHTITLNGRRRLGTKVATVDLTSLYRSKGMKDTFTVTQSATFTAKSSCATTGYSWSIFLKSVSASGTQTRDGPSLYGNSFQGMYASCFTSSREVGRCAPKGACPTGFKAAGGAVSASCDRASSTCCVPDFTAGSRTNGEWMQFTVPHEDKDTIVYSGTSLTLEWAYDTTTSWSTRECTVNGDDQFELLLYKKVPAAWWALLADDDAQLVNNFGKFKPSDMKSTPIRVEGKAGKELEEATYYFVARFSPGCVVRSREMPVTYAGCNGGASETIVGQCLPTTHCDTQEKQTNSRLCAGMTGHTCCYAERTGMSAGFRDNKETLDAPASILSVSLVAVVAAVAARVF